MRGFLIAIPIVLIVMSMSACQGSAGPAGEQDQQVKRPLWTRMNFNWFSNSWKALKQE